MKRPEQVDRTTPEPARDAVRDLERRLLGAERTMRRREMAAGAGVSLLSARKLWRAMGFPNLGDEEVFFTTVDQDALEADARHGPRGHADRGNRDLADPLHRPDDRPHGGLAGRGAGRGHGAEPEDERPRGPPQPGEPAAGPHRAARKAAGLLLAPAAERRGAPAGAARRDRAWPPPPRAATAPRTTPRCRWPAPWASPTWSPTPRSRAG